VPLIFGIVLALQAVIYTYDGWSGCIYFSEEVRDPGRNIPRAMFGGVLSILGIYLLLNAALVYILPISRIAGEPFALGLAAQALFGAYGDTTIRSLMVVSMLSGINAYHLMATRVLFAMSRDGLLSRYAARVNPGGTPSVALFASAFVAVLFIVLSGAFRKLIAVMSFFFVANYTVSFLAVFILRRREPDAPRPYRTWGHPWTTGFALAGSVAFLIGAIWNDLATGTRDSIYTLLVLAASYPIYRISRSLAGTTSS
jgi:APA family basic amino acid/polyamine antiporter